MKKKPAFGANMVIVCYLLLKEANIRDSLICFDHIFDYHHINVVTFVPRKQSKRPQFSTKTVVEKAFDMCLLLGLSSLFSQSSHTLLKARHLIIVPLKQ